MILPLSDSDRGRLRFRFFRRVLFEIRSVLAVDGDPGGNRIGDDGVADDVDGGNDGGDGSHQADLVD